MFNKPWYPVSDKILMNYPISERSFYEGATLGERVVVALCSNPSLCRADPYTEEGAIRNARAIIKQARIIIDKLDKAAETDR